MKSLKFKLSGDHAFFKDNSINSIYLTYGNIHRVALLGMFGAILGLGGYAQQANQMQPKKKQQFDEYPEFYEKLQDLKVAIVPLSQNGTFSKKMQTFNNSVGYASKEQGGNLIVKQYWLENPAWEVYVLLDSDIAEELASKIINREATYIPYLGANNHFANITDMEILDSEEVYDTDGINVVSVVKEESVKLKKRLNKKNGMFKYVEYLPVTLSSELNQHIKEKMIATNFDYQHIDDPVYGVSGKNIVFY